MKTDRNRGPAYLFTIVLATVLVLAAIMAATINGCRYEPGSGEGTGDASIAEAIDKILTDTFPEGEPGAAVIVERAGEVVLRQGYGMADMELAVPFTADMVSRIGSVTKQITAAAVMILAEDGELSLNDPVRMFIPRLPGRFSPVRIKHLLSNTSGIPDYMQTEEFDLLIQEEYHDIVNEDVDLDRIMRIIAESGLDFEPGERYSYSNSNYFLLAKVIEMVTGQVYFDFVRRKICEPAGMANTHYIAGVTFIPGRVPVHLEFEGQIIKNPHRTMGSTLGLGAGGLWSTVDDMARYNRALESGKIVTAETLDEMSRRYTLNDGSESRYGLGWQISEVKGRKTVFHGGDYAGYSALIMRIPSEDIFISILSNDGRLYAFNLEYPAKKIAALLFGDPFPEWEAIHMMPEELENYAGTYRIGESDVREFIVAGGRAYTSRNGRSRLEVYPSSDSTFFYTESLSYIEFEFDGAGVPTHMVMHRDTGQDEVATRVR